MTDRRPIAEFFAYELAPEVVVGDDQGNEAEAAIDPDSDPDAPTWVDLTDPDRPIELSFSPTWFRLIDRA